MRGHPAVPRAEKLVRREGAFAVDLSCTGFGASIANPVCQMVIGILGWGRRTVHQRATHRTPVTDTPGKGTGGRFVIARDGYLAVSLD